MLNKRQNVLKTALSVLIFAVVTVFLSCTVSPVQNVSLEEGISNSSFRSVYSENTQGSKSGVMLQGFNWESASRTDSSTWYNWYSVMEGKASEIKNTFEYVWFPPPSATASFGPEGYLPTELNEFDSYYGTEEELKDVIEAISPAKAIADIVINHRCGTSDWGDFTNPSWTEDFYSICSDDEGFTGSPVMSSSGKRGNPDTGEGYSAARDLDHTNASVQNGIISWMNTKLKALGFVGWRYDFVKGYDGYYVGKYNDSTDAVFAVGEYWPTDGFNPNYSQGWKDEIMAWINRTNDGGYKTRAFDFVLKGNLNYAFGYGGNTNLWDMSRLADSNNIFRQAPEYAVTFIDNHDTGSTQQHWEMDSGDLGPAYAFILTHPGYPCVAWQHYFTGNGSQYKAGNIVHGTSNTLRQHIDKLIEIRKNSGICYDSQIQILSSSQYLYAAKISGEQYDVVVKIGGENYTPDGDYTLVYSGTNFSIWTTDSEGGTEPVIPGSDYRLISTADPGYGQAVYFTGTFDEGENWTKALRGTYDASVGGWYIDVTGSNFEWKYLTGSYDLGEVVSSPFAGLTWCSGNNFTQNDAVQLSQSVSPEPEPENPVSFVTLSAYSDVGNGNALFFTGTFEGGDNWSTALRGTWNEGNVWTCTVPAGTFEWKCLKGSYILGEEVSTGSGLIWESGNNHDSGSTEITPAF